MPGRQSGPLKGLKVLDLTHVMAGPVAAMMLADLGADVIKVEKVPIGDDTRRTNPPAVGDQSASFLMMNTSKRGIGLDLKAPAGRDVLRRLAKDADILLENFRPGTLEKFGLGYDALREINPRLIYGVITGYGRTGPYSERAGFDLVAQGMSGLMSVTGEGPDSPPTKCGPPLTDITAGILLAMGVLAAVYERATSGEGQKVDTSLLEAGITHTYWHSAIALATGRTPVAMGSAHPLSAPYQALPTADGWINLGAANEANWTRFVKAVGHPELAEDSRFARNADRMENLKELEAVLSDILKEKPSEHWLDLLDEAGVPAGPILTVNEMHRHPQVVAREMVPEAQHSTLGPVKTIGVPVKFSRTSAKVAHSAPVYGEHSREILAEHGFSQDEIETLVRDGAVIAA